MQSGVELRVQCLRGLLEAIESPLQLAYKVWLRGHKPPRLHHIYILLQIPIEKCTVKIEQPNTPTLGES